MKYDTFYVTRYMGAKYKLLNFIAPVLLELCDENLPIIDLMAGTHAVGYALKSQRKIISCDVQFYSKIFGETLVQNNQISSVKERWDLDFADISFIESENNWFVKKYSNSYFSYAQCVQIAAIRARIKKVPNPILQSFYLTCLAYAMSLCQSSSGHFAQYLPESNPRTLVLRDMDLFKSFKERCLDVEIILGKFQNEVFNMESSQFLNTYQNSPLIPPGSVVYLDPPYSPAQYSRYYHLLETVFLDDDPDISFKGLYRADRYQSDFCSSKSAPAAFEEIIRVCSDSSWSLVISYASSGVVEPNLLLQICQKYYPNAFIKRQKYSHSTQGRGEIRNIDELLIICSKTKNEADFQL